MPDSPAFEMICDEVERATPLDRLEARGTVRIVLKEAGLEPRSATPRQMAVAIEQLLPAELASRGIESGDALCSRLTARLCGSYGSGTEAEATPEAVFARLGGRPARGGGPGPR